MATHSKTVTLARVSSKSQEDGYSLDVQQKLIDRYCEDKNLRVIKRFRISETASKNEQRKVFRELLAYIKQHGVANLVVEKTDRLTRNMRDAVVVDDWLDGNMGRRLHMVKENLILHKNSKSDEKLMWNIYLAFAKKYTDTLREEAMKGWQEKLAQGWMPSSPPQGYKTVTENGKKIHVIDVERSFLVERAFRLYLQPDQNIATVHEEVTRCGMLTSKGRPLARSAVHKLLRNPFYIGTIRFNNKEYSGAHEPLLTYELFMAVQNKLDNGYHSHQREHKPLFKGELVCDMCNKTMTWQLQKGRYYGACQRRSDACRGRRLLREDRLEDQLLTCIDEIDSSRARHQVLRRLTGLLESRRQPYIGQHRETVIKAVAQQIRRLEQMDDHLYEDKLAGVTTKQRYDQKTSELHDELTILRERLIKLESITTKPSKADEPASIRELYTQESNTGKRAIVHELFIMFMQNGKVHFDLRTH